MPMYDGQGKGDFKSRGSGTEIGLIKQERFGLAAEECGPVGREQARKDVRLAEAEGQFKWKIGQYDQDAGPSGEGVSAPGGEPPRWKTDKAKVAGVAKSGIASASKQDDE